ncbi:MAG: DNA-binding protein WhiA [Clostridia bacterium]|nr:DNA-binding protein WhiA [Clostridia bacterium]
MTAKIRDIIFEELLKKPIKKEDFYQYISGVIRGCGILNLGRNAFTLELEHKSYEFLKIINDYVQEIYKYEIEEETTVTLLKGDKSVKKYSLIFSPNSSKDILNKAYILNNNLDFYEDFPPKFFKGRESQKEYLKGLYLACGNIRIPESENSTSGYTLSFNLNSGTAQDAIINLLANCLNITDKKIFRKAESNEIFLKDSDCIESFFAYIGCPTALFTIMQVKMERKIKNDANRARNADIANINRIIEAGNKQKDAIEKLMASREFNKLSDELKETCEKRLNNLDLDLTSLGQMFNPPVSKSCINHRLRRIIELANKL